MAALKTLIRARAITTQCVCGELFGFADLPSELPPMTSLLEELQSSVRAGSSFCLQFLLTLMLSAYLRLTAYS